MGLRIRCGKKIALLTKVCKKFTETGKIGPVKLERESHVDFFFTSKVLCITNSYVMVK
jgi:hypothetical protein